VADVLIFADTVRSADLRHEVPLLVPDSFLYAERDGERHVVVSSLEAPRLEELGGYTIHPLEEFGLDELRRTKGSVAEVLDEISVRAARAIGIERALVPPTFPLASADCLRAAGIELTPDESEFVDRRRVKSGAELDGIRNAQAAAEAGMALARDLLRDARVNEDGELELEGTPLTCGRIKAAISAAFVERDASSSGFVVSHGAQAAIGHELGSGAIRAGETVVVDLWPADNASSCFADMTRTFVVGDVPEEVAGWHTLCLEALERSKDAIRPGATARSVYDAACDVFEEGGFLTQRSKPDGTTLEDGFTHALGHAVGLEVHELPVLNLLGRMPLVSGEVLALEPGLYRQGFGGLRVEDLVRVTDDGCETLTSFSYELAL
jgi:Xaa-Pro aminopeptidase